MQAGALPRTVRLPGARVPFTVVGAFIAIAGFGAYFTSQDFKLGAYWFIGVAFGVILQRSRLCFAGAFRDLIMGGDGRLLRAILVGLAVATVGMSFLMARFVPDPSFGTLPPGAHIQTVSFATVVGGVVFGIGMVLAGGCVSGTLWRMGEGYLNSWVAMVGILGGLWAGTKTWSWWWDHDVSKREATWLPAKLGMLPSIALVLAALGAIYVAVLWWELRSPQMPEPAAKPTTPAFTVRDHVGLAWSRAFRGGAWSYLTGAVCLAILGTFAYNIQAPLGVTGGLGLWTDQVASAFHAGGLPLKGADQLAGCTAGGGANWLTIRTMTMSGLVLGAFTASVVAGEFKIRFPRRAIRYPQALAGGALMGYGALLAVGCTIGAFFSSIPSLAVSGWLFGIALFAGAFVGVQIIRRLP